MDTNPIRPPAIPDCFPYPRTHPLHKVGPFLCKFLILTPAGIHSLSLRYYISVNLPRVVVIVAVVSLIFFSMRTEFMRWVWTSRVE